MAFTSSPIDAPVQAHALPSPNQLDLEVKEFQGYDPKGTTTITNSPIAANKTAEPTEPAAAPIPTAPEDTVSLSPKVSALARKEQAQRQKEQSLIKREKELEAKLADAEKYQALKTKIAAKDYTAADELGLNYDEFVKHELNKEAGKSPEEIRFRKVEEELSNFKKAQEEQTVKEYQANQALWKQEISKVVSENDDFSTIRELKAEDIVQQHINDSFDEDGVELTVEQAAKEIEAALLKHSEKFANISKLKNKVPEAKVLGAPKTSPKTITQNMTTTPKTAQVSKPFHLMSESEQLQEAIRRVNAAKIQR